MPGWTQILIVLVLIVLLFGRGKSAHHPRQVLRTHEDDGYDHKGQKFRPSDIEHLRS